jgi:hypothetical protein
LIECGNPFLEKVFPIVLLSPIIDPLAEVEAVFGLETSGHSTVAVFFLVGLQVAPALLEIVLFLIPAQFPYKPELIERINPFCG